MDDKLRELENRIKETETKIENCKNQKKNIEINARKLKARYDIGELSYEDYESWYKRLFGEKTLQQWISYYDIQLKTYQAQLDWREKELKKELKRQKKTVTCKTNSRANEIIERIKKAESNKKEIIARIQQLASKYSAGEISHDEYQKTVKGSFGEKTPEEWVDYYDDYIRSCRKIFEQQGREKRKQIKNIALVAIAILALLIPVFLLIYSDFSLTGRTVELVKETHTDEINFETTESADYEWNLDNLGKLDSVRVSGEIEGEGAVRIYLDDILILDSDNFAEENTPLTGGIITGFNTEGSETGGDGSGDSEGDNGGTSGDDSSSETGEDSSDNSGSEESGSNEGNSQEEEGSRDSGETQEDENTGDEQPNEENETQPGNETEQEGEQDEGEVDEQTKTIPFSNVCEETCDISSLGLDRESYTLRIEISNAKLKLNEIKYEIEKAGKEENNTEEIPKEPIENVTEPTPEINVTINETAPVLIMQIPDVTIEKDNYYDLKLTEYFSNGDNFFLLQTQNLTTTSFDHTIRIQPDENFTGSREVKIIAQNDFGTAESNLFNITVADFADELPQLIKAIPPIIIFKNNQTEIKLEEYFLNAEEFFFLQTQNISTTTYDHIIVLQPEENFTGIRTSKIIATNKFGDIESNFFNISIIDGNVSEVLNETKNETGNVSINTLQYKAVINKPTKWIKTVNASDPEDLKEFLVEIPREAGNISILPGEGEEEAQDKIDTFEEDLENADKEDIISGAAITGNVAFEVGYKKGILIRIWEFITKGGITGRVADEGNDTTDEIIETDEGKFVNLTSIVESTNASEVNIEYITPGPQAFEEVTGTGKKVFVSGDEELNFTDILAFAEIPELRNVGEESEIKVLWIEENIFVNFSTSDLDGNGKIDYIEWIVPHLSNQTFQIIVIIKAEHLDENRSFISDIYEDVFQLDGNWSETIPDTHYVRVTFEQNLTSANDITLFPRTVNGTPRIEVYKFNQSELIVAFENISDNEYNKVYLTNLGNKTQDTFDLLILNGSVEFDHIIDPTVSVPAQNGTGTNVTIQTSFSHLAIGSNTKSSLNTTSLIFYLPFDSNVTANITQDYSDHLDGNYSAGAYYNDTGLIGGGVVLDGINDFMEFGGDGNIGERVTEITVSVWVRKTLADIPGNQWILDKTGAGADTLEIFLQGNDRPQWRVYNATAVAAAGNDAAFALSDTNWHHLVGTYNGTTVILYVDGAQSTTTAILGGATSTTSNDLNIGARSTGTVSFFNGTIDEVMIINRTLSSTEVTNLYNNLTSRFYGRGEQIISNLNVSGDGTENLINITINSTMLKGSMINVSVGSSSGGTYSYGSELAFTNNFISGISISSTNISLKFIFYPGNVTTEFYAPTLENNVQIDSYAAATSDTSAPIVNLLHPSNGSSTLNQNVYFAANITDNVNVTNATLYIWNTTALVGTNTTIIGAVSAVANLSFTLPGYDTYRWNYLAFDNSPNSAFNATNFTLAYSRPPYVILNSPANHSIFALDVFNISLNATGVDPEGGTVDIFLYGVASDDTANFYKHGLLAQRIGVVNATEIFYNWTAPVIVPDGNAVLLMHFDNRSLYGENQTVVTDFSNYANNATAGGNSRPNMAGGSLAGGWEFDGRGSGDRLSISHNDIFNVSQLTIALWIKPYDSRVSNGFLLSKDGQTTTGFTFQIDYVTNTTEFSPEGSVFNNSDNNVFTRNNWTHVAVTANSTTINLYVNGILNKSHIGSFSYPNNTNSLLAGGSAQSIVGAQGFNGTMDELVFYNRSLADYEIKNLYRLNADKYFWKVNITDSNANNNESATRDLIVRGPHVIVENSMTCSDLLTHVKNIDYGYTCTDAAYTSCVGLNSAVNVTLSGILHLPNTCELFFNSSGDGVYSLFVNGKLNMTGANVTSVSSTNKFNLTAFNDNFLYRGSSGNLSFANFIRQTNITDSNINFVSVDIENNVILLNSSDTNSYTINGGSLDRRFRLNVSVYADGSPVSGVNVTARNVSNSIIFSKLTGSDGAVYYNLTQYLDTGGGKSLWNNYTINVTKLGYLRNSTSLNITVDTNLAMSIKTVSIIEVSTKETLHDIFTRVADSSVFGNLSDGTRPCRYVSTASVNVTSAGHLVMEDCTLEINSTSNDGQYDIYIGGQLTANYSNFTKGDSKNYEFILESNSGSQIKNSFISYIGKSAISKQRGLEIYSNNLTFYNNTITKGWESNVEVFANSVEFYSSNFIVTNGSNNYNLYIVSNSSKVADSNISGAALSDIVVLDNNNLTVLNTNYSTHNIQPGGFIYRQWYVDARVQDTLGNNLTNANVSFHNNTGNLLITVLTNSSGTIVRQNVTEYAVNGTAWYYQSNYTVNATKLGYGTESQSVNLTTKKNLTFATLFNAVPTFTLNSLVNASTFVIHQHNRTLNVTGYDTNADLVDILIYGINSTSTLNFYKHGLLAQRIGVANNTQLVYNWTAPTIIPDSSTILLFHFDNRSFYGENNTFVFDYSTFGRLNGTLVGNARPNMTGGSLAGGWEFDGLAQGDYLNVPFNLAGPTLSSVQTIVAWVKPYSNGKDGYIVSRASGSGGVLNGYFFMINYTTNATLFGNGTAGSIFSSDNNVFTRNNWTHVAVTANATAINLYVNGILNKTNTGAFSYFSNTNNLRVGATTDAGAGLGVGGFNGTMDELGLYNRTLSSTEILNLYRMDADKYFWKVNVTDQGAGNSNESETRELTITDNTAPTVIFVETISAVSPTEGSTTAVTFKFTAADTNGASDLNGATAKANFTRVGEEIRQNSSCATVSGENIATTQNYSCIIYMWYYDAPGGWNVTASISDLGGSSAVNTTTNFTYNQLQAITISPNSLTWATLLQNATNQTSNNDPTLINNTGNYNAAAVRVTAYNLHGQRFSSDYISAGNFTIDIETGGSPPAECFGNVMSNWTATAITGAILNRGNNSVNDGSSGQEQLYYCITQVPQLSSQTYSTTYTGGSWIVSILAAVFAVKRKKKKKSKEELLEIFDKKLERKYKLEIERLLNAEEEIEQKYDVSVKELLEAARTKRAKESEFEVPIEIFSGEICPAEALCKYLREEKEMRFSDIARLINRDQRTVWISYRNASIKEAEFNIKNRKATVSIEIFSNPKASILESLIYYLRERGFTNSEIARLLNKDPRNTWTIYTRAVRKKLSENNRL